MKIKLGEQYKNEKGYPFPSEDILQSEKDKDGYFLAACNAILGKFINNQCFIHYDAVSQRRPIWELRAYRYGRNSPDKYKNYICGLPQGNRNLPGNQVKPGEHGGGRKTTINISWDILQILPQKIDAVMGYLKKIRFDITTHAIDYQALISKKTSIAMAKLLADDRMRLAQQTVNEAAGRQVIQDMDPSQMPGGMPFANPKEVDMAAAVGVFFLQEEAAIKMLLDKTQYDSGWDGISDKLDDDFVTIGTAITMASTNPNTLIVEDEYVDPDRAMFPFSIYNDHRDGTWGGFIKTITIGELRKKTDLKEEEYVKIAKQYASNNATGVGTTNFYYNIHQERQNSQFGMNMMDQIEVDIAVCWWIGKKGVNYTSVRRKREGNLIMNVVDDDYDLAKVSNSEGKTLNKDTGMTIYKSCLVIGTSHVFDHGQDTDIAFEKKNGTMWPIVPMKIVTTGNSSLVERCIGFVDDANLDNYKLRVARMRMPAPPNLMIRKSALDKVQLDGVTYKPTQLMRLLSDEGFLIVDDQNGWGNQVNGGKAIETIPTDIIKQLLEWRNDIEWNITMIERVTGINELFSAQTQAPDTGLGVSNLLMAATNNALTPIITAKEYIYEQTMRINAKKWQIVACYMTDEQRSRLSINRALAYVKVGANLSEFDFDIQLQAGMTDDEKNALLADIAKMRDLRRQAGTGGITESDWFLVQSQIRARNMVQAQLLLAQLSEMRMEQDSAKQEKLVAQNAQVQQASNQQTSQNKLQEIGAEGQVDQQNKSSEIQEQFQADMALQIQKAADDRRLAALTNVFGSSEKKSA